MFIRSLKFLWVWFKVVLFLKVYWCLSLIAATRAEGGLVLVLVILLNSSWCSKIAHHHHPRLVCHFSYNLQNYLKISMHFQHLYFWACSFNIQSIGGSRKMSFLTVFTILCFLTNLCSAFCLIKSGETQQQSKIFGESEKTYNSIVSELPKVYLLII